MYYAIRREWPDGHHEYIGPQTDLTKAKKQIVRDEAFWRHPTNDGNRPSGHQVVLINEQDFWAHTKISHCSSPKCPVAITTDQPSGSNDGRVRS